MSLKNEKYTNKLESGRKKKFGKGFAEIPKGKHYVEELEPLIGAVIILECDDWVFIPGELEGIPCEKLLLKSSKVIKCPKGREVKCPVEISKNSGQLLMLISENGLAWNGKKKNANRVSTEQRRFVCVAWCTNTRSLFMENS